MGAFLFLDGTSVFDHSPDQRRRGFSARVELRKNPFISNADWYLGGWRGRGTPRYDFVVLPTRRQPDLGVGWFDSLGLPRSAVEEKFGLPAAQELCGELEVWIYNRPTDRRLCEYVRAEPPPQ